MSSFPIAVLDTGAGGLSVVQAIRRLLPREDVFYFADTAHVPYGIKSPELIKHLAIKIAKTATSISSCKVLVIACHTISVNCLKEIEQIVSIPVIGMVEPSLSGLRLLMANEHYAAIGILSTRATLDSKIYRNAWPSIDKNANTQLVEQACGPLVSLVEESDFSYGEQVFILENFLSSSIKQCDALLIGCTHFSALIPALAKVIAPHCVVVDAADYVVSKLAFMLEESRAFSKNQSSGRLIVHVTDNPERFKNIACRFMQEELSIQLIKDYVVF